MSGNLGLGEPLNNGPELQEVTTAAAIFSKNTWNEVTEDEAHVVATTKEGASARMKVRVLAHRGAGVCDLEARTQKPGDLVGTVQRVQLYVERRLVADQGFNQYLGPSHRLSVQFRIVATQILEEGLGV